MKSRLLLLISFVPKLTFSFGGGGGVIKRPHLGLGGITDWSKLPVNNYDSALLNCKKFYRLAGIGCIGVWQGSNRAFFSSTFEVKMRTAPTIALISTDVTIRTLGVGDVISSSAELTGITRTTEDGIDYVAIEGFTGGIDKSVCVPGSNIFSLIADLG